MTLAAALSAVTASDATFSVAGAAAWLTVTGRTATLSGVADATQGGTGSAFFTVAGPTQARTYTFPDAAATIARIDAGQTFAGTQVFSNTITGSISGNAATVTTNANLTGPVTSTGNATAIANGAIALAKLADGTAGNVITYSAAGAIAVVATGTATHVLTSNGAGAAPTFQAAAGGGATLNGITAATGAVTIANANNTGIVWNWANTTDSTIAFTYGETSAATGGTLNNQVLLRVATTTSSTQVPLSIEQDTPTSTVPSLLIGAHAASATLCGVQNFRFSAGTLASPTVITTGDDLGRIGAAGFVGATNKYVEAARITFDSAGTIADTSTGVGGIIRFSTRNVGAALTEVFKIDNAKNISLVPAGSRFFFPEDGTASLPTLTFTSGGNNSGFYGSAVFTALSLGTVEQVRWTDAGIQRNVYAADDAVSYAFNIRKARGTVASPTVITTGDVLMTQSAYAYLGVTNTYRETGRVEIKSKGTISDATNGVGSVVTIYGKTQGTDATVQPTLVITDGSTASIKFAGTGMFTANGSTIATIGATCPGNATVQNWLTITDSGGTVRYIPCF